MQEIFQHTINKSISFEGIGLHTGKISKVKLMPGSENQGIIFKRVDLKENNIIKANFNNVSSARLCTTLENTSGTKISTVEHLLAALYIFGIDNVTIEINSEEVPIMDGSSKEFLEILNKTGSKKLNKKRKFLKILNKVSLEDKERRISIEPCGLDFEVEFQLNYENKVIGKQKNLVNFSTDDLKDVYNSRTFCLFEDIEMIKKKGLAKGGSLKNAIVVKDDQILNEEGLRNDKEFVNHKILDCIGDLYTSGYRIIAAIKCSQGGHFLTNQLLRKVFQNKENFSILEIKEKNLPHTLINKNILRSIA